MKNDSFFNFFDPPQVPKDVDVDIPPKTTNLLKADFKRASFLRKNVVPKAVLFFTGTFRLVVLRTFINKSVFQVKPPN